MHRHLRQPAVPISTSVEADEADALQLDDFTVIRSDLAGDRIVDKLADVTGLEVKRVSNLSEANIVFDCNNGKLLESGSWGTVTEDGKLTIVGGDEIESRKAVNYFTNLLDSTSGELAIPTGEYSVKQITREEYYEMKQLVISPEFPEQIIRDYTYTVSVTQGDRTAALPVYNHTMESTVSRNTDGADNY